MNASQLLMIPLLCCLSLFACSNEEGSQLTEHGDEEQHEESQDIMLSPGQIKLMNIEVSPPSKRQLAGYISAPARIESVPGLVADIGTLISGRVRAIHAVEGERVRQEQVLLEIQGLEIGEIFSEYVRSHAAMVSAKANHDRQRTLLEEDIAAKRTFVEAEAVYKEGRSAFIAAKQKLHSIGIIDKDEQALLSLAIEDDWQTHSTRFSTLKIKSPISGVVGRSTVRLGQMLDPNNEVMQVVNSEKVWAVADIYAKDLEKIGSGQAVEITSEANPALLFRGTLDYISPVIDPESRTLKVRSTIENPQGDLKLGMFAKMRIYTSSQKSSVVLPESAVENDGNSDIVFIQLQRTEHLNHSDPLETRPSETESPEEPNIGFTFRRVPVQIGIREDGYVEILAGIKEDQFVVVNGAFFLKSELLKDSFGGHAH